MKQCDGVARKTREQIEEQSNMKNSKHYGCYSMKIECKVQERPKKEMTRTIDAKNSEENYAKAKFGCKIEFIDVKARSTFKINKITTSMMKCAHGNNHYGERDAIMNKDITNQECPRCNEIESWNHVIKCKNTSTCMWNT